MDSNWIHTQVSTPNEMVLSRLKVDIHKKNIIQWFKRRLIEHLFIAHGNMHSDQSNGYFIVLKKSINNNSSVLYSRREHVKSVRSIIKKSIRRLFGIFQKIRCYVLLPFVQNSIESGGFHVGGTMPMTKVPEKETDTNTMGNPKDWNHIHVIDSSVFPSLPGTTIGLLAMANSARIASELNID
jgi:choline dehydrogenase-like flavoprotein